MLLLLHPRACFAATALWGGPRHAQWAISGRGRPIGGETAPSGRPSCHAGGVVASPPARQGAPEFGSIGQSGCRVIRSLQRPGSRPRTARTQRTGVNSSLVPHVTDNPYNIPVFDLMHRPGETREREVDVVVPEGFGNAMVGVRDGAMLRLDVRLESLHDGILVSADVDTVAEGQCGRCLDDIALPVQVEIQELFAYSEDEAFDYTVSEDHIDLEPLVRDAVVLSLPFQPVCRPDCPGLDPETGERLADFPDRKPAEVLDPRWSALAGLTPTEPDVAGSEATEREKS